MPINHEKYTLVIVDEYSRYTWVHFLKKKSQAPEMIMSFIKMVENENDVKVKQIRTDNGDEFRNHELETERKNRTLIEADRTMLNGSVLSKHFWTEAVRITSSTSSHPAPQDRWSTDQHIELVNIIGNPGEGMLTRSMDAKLTVASASECLFANFLSEIEPKKVSEALKHPGWVDAMQEELNQFYRNKVWTLVPLPYRKTAIGSK
ncbi:retrovirus-related pol polyprotein from transposon TNT 1-94 [Tanacetum coccineum]|uniref:Retrovirus-related pol polyprotein from transposon TNT 1-94 n=1 Tax=Tanacetum coccineum TaxID=301880 RepID=A0ABQ4Y491_9ASTR